MVVAKYKLPSKLLTIICNNHTIYIGSFTGQIYIQNSPSYTPKEFIKLNEPVSSLDIFMDSLVIGTWSGNLYQNKNLKLNLGRYIIKAIKSFEDKLFVSHDSFVFILNNNFEIQKKIDLKCKILCFYIFQNNLLCGTNNNQLIKFERENALSPLTIETKHLTSILDIDSDGDQLITCSADKTIRKNDICVYEGNNWIYSVTKNAFGDGKNLFINNKLVFKHSDMISGIVETENKIISIGLDGVVAIYSENMECTAEEEEEIRNLLNDN